VSFWLILKYFKTKLVIGVIHLGAGWFGSRLLIIRLFFIKLLKDKLGENTSENKATKKVARHCCTVYN